MRALEEHSQFKKDVRREARSGVLGDLLSVLVALATDQPLAEKYRDHALTGDWKDYRDCHVRPDLVLIYKKTPGKLGLFRLGSHSELGL